MRYVVESVKDFSYDTTYGIATVQPNRAIKICRIRNLRIEYFTNDIATILTMPRSCGSCKRLEECTDDFILQIMEKICSSKKSPDEIFYFKKEKRF